MVPPWKSLQNHNSNDNNHHKKKLHLTMHLANGSQHRAILGASMSTTVQREKDLKAKTLMIHKFTCFSFLNISQKSIDHTHVLI